MDKNVFVSGADRGLGFSLCEELLNAGWKVFAGQFIPDWPELKGLEQKFQDKLHIIPLNVGSIESVEAAKALIECKVDHLDMLISNAGVSFEYR